MALNSRANEALVRNGDERMLMLSQRRRAHAAAVEPLLLQQFRQLCKKPMLTACQDTRSHSPPCTSATMLLRFLNVRPYCDIHFPIRAEAPFHCGVTLEPRCSRTPRRFKVLE